MPLAVPPEDVLQAVPGDLVPSSSALLSSGSPLPTTKADISLLNITAGRRAKHLSDGQGVHNVKKGGLFRSDLLLGANEDRNIVPAKHNNVHDAALSLVAVWKSKVGRNDRDRTKSRCMETEDLLKDENLKHVNLLNHIHIAHSKHTRKSFTYCCEAKMSETKATASSATAKLLALSNVQLTSMQWHDIEHKHTNLNDELEILNRQKEHAISEL